MRTKGIILVGLLIWGCEKEEFIDACADTGILNDPACQTFIGVGAPCMLLEVVKRVNGNELEKYVYHHNGSNFSQIDVFAKEAFQDQYPNEPAEIVNLIYENSRIKQVTVQPLATPNVQRKAYYEYSDESVKTTIELIENGVVFLTESFDQMFLVNPKDSVYQSEGYFDILREYKDGNNTRFAVEADSGLCIINDKKWVFTVRTSYDLNPNVFSDYSVRFPLGKETGFAGQFWFGNNKNNIVATIDPRSGKNKIVYCYSFLQSDDQIWIKEYEFTSAYEYNYTFRYSCE